MKKLIVITITIIIIIIIAVPPANVKFSHESSEETERTKISCSADGIYPSPTARVYWKDG